MFHVTANIFKCVGPCHTYTNGRLENELCHVVLEHVLAEVLLAEVVRLPGLRLRLEAGEVERLPRVLSPLIQGQATRNQTSKSTNTGPRSAGIFEFFDTLVIKPLWLKW